MSRAFDHPPLTPQFCFNETALRDFLRLSRSTIDDSITSNLNSLLTPSTSAWDPKSSSSRPRTTPPASKRPMPPNTCSHFKSAILFPSWQSRSDVLTYCAAVATSPDPSDPDQLLRDIEDEKARQRIVDERLDPYSGRYFPREVRTESLAALVRRERMVEDIIRRRTWGLVGERCNSNDGVGWEQAVEEWGNRNST
ncbi:hypothetical protein EJ08DRAFT_481576 [Tothia fuscella]|uniref:Caffeine-induced death protein Cid2 n=1 Tax=Tothia fuscella TaxID=1048955 RepID=A0A9P4NID8_9PEZI|nr:hypothetical protein EJ08DRAFT_481576 [Tothia fuscella]